MPDFGIGEAIAGLIGGGDVLGGLFGGGAAAGEAAAAGGAEAAGAGLGTEGAALGLAPEAAAASGADVGLLADLGGASVGGAPAGAAPAASADLASTIGAGGFPSAQGVGQGAAAFAPAPGVQLPGGIAADATSAAAFDPLSFADRALPAVQAGQNGTFAGFELPQSPVGSGAGAVDFSAAPGGGGSPFGTTGTPTATPSLGDFTTPPGAAPGQASIGGGGFDVSGNPIDPLTGSSNPQYPGGGISTAYDPTGATVGGAQGTSAAAAPGSTNILGKVGQGALDSVTKNPLGIGLGAAGLGLTLANANKLSGATQDVKNQATKQSATADQLANYALTGTVPAGSQAAIDQSIAEAKANAISNAAGQGLPTDPTKNTALAATLAKIDAQRPILAQQIATQLLSSGATYAGLSDQLYTQLAQIDQSQRASMGKAIANFAAALNTGGGTKIQIGGTSA